MRMGRGCGNKCGQNVLYTYMKLSKNIINIVKTKYNYIN